MREQMKIIFPTFKSFSELLKEDSRRDNKYKSIFCPVYDINSRSICFPIYYLEAYRKADALGVSASALERKLERHSIRPVSSNEMKMIINNGALSTELRTKYNDILDGEWCYNKEVLSMLLTVVSAIKMHQDKEHFKFALTGTSEEFDTHNIFEILDEQINKSNRIKKYPAY